MIRRARISRSLRRRRHADGGVSLVLALLFLLVVGVTAAAALSFSSTGLKVGPVYDDRSTAVQDVEGALQAAIAEVHNSTYNYTGGDPNCFSGGAVYDPTATTATYTDGTPTISRTYPAKRATSGNNQVAVSCAPGPATGDMSQLVPVQCADPTSAACNRPGNAILTLDPVTETREPGLEVDNRLLTVQGRIFSNSTIELSATRKSYNRSASSFCPFLPQPPNISGCVELYSPIWQIIARGKCTENGVDVTDPTKSHIISNPPRTCKFGNGDDKGYGQDPGYQQPKPALAGLTLRTVAPPPSRCSSWPQSLTLDPGYYDDADALSAWTNTGDDCDRRYHNSYNSGFNLILNPGTYYFDFRNEEMPARGTTAVPNDENVWSISGQNVTVVGGTLSTGVTADNVDSKPIPGACVSPLDSKNAQGVQLVFGGDSRIEYEAGRVELCGSYSGTSAPIPVIYGATQNPTYSTAPAPVTPVAALGTGTNSFTTTPSGQALTNIAASNEAPARLVATASLKRPSSSRSAITGTLPLAYSIPAGTIPAGSILTSASLTVVHRETGTSTGQTNTNCSATGNGNGFGFGSAADDALCVVVNSTRSGATASAEPLNPTTGTNPAWATDVVDLTSDLVQEVHDYGLTGLTLGYSAIADGGNASGTGSLDTLTAAVDKVSLALTYTLPSVRSEKATLTGVSNCIAAIPYIPGTGGTGGGDGDGGGHGQNGTNCALISSTANGHGDEGYLAGTFYVQGTVYAPSAAVELILPQQTKQAVRSGLIARSVRVNVRQHDERNRDRPTQVSIAVPNDSLGPAPVDVYFTAYTCPAGGTCTRDPITGVLSGSWVKAGLARVSFIDPSPFVQVAGSRQVKINSWQILR